MRILPFLLIILVAPVLVRAQATIKDSAYLLKPARVFDGEQMHEGWQVLVRNGIIEAAGAGISAPARCRVIVLKDCTLLPGLIEGHSHLFLHPYNETTWNDQVLKEPRAERTARAVNHARETLLAGGQACRPLIARDGLSAVLVEPAIKLLRDKGASIQYGHELHEFGMSAGRVGELKFGDGTLAIFADHDLLLTTGLREHAAADPMRLERVLSAGPHQLRVALYRADKSLQTEKEGLGELRAGTENILTIRVSKRPKMLVRRETALEVIWPSAISPQPQNATSSSSVTTALK